MADDMLDLACSTAASAGQIIAKGRTAALTSFAFATESEEFARTRIRQAAPVACRRGCSWCCRSMTVGASIPEAIAVAAHIRTKFDVDDRARVDRNLDEYVRATEGMALPVWDHAAVTCPFLAGRECSVYDARPAMCRRWHSFDAAACRADAKRPVGEEHRPIPHDDTVDRVVVSIQAGVQAAIRAAGFDYRDIDYPLGVRLALADPTLIDTWWDRPRAFDSAAIDRAHPGAPDRRVREAFADGLYGEILAKVGERLLLDLYSYRIKRIMGASLKAAYESVRNLMRQAKEEGQREGTANLPLNYGDQLLARERTEKAVRDALSTRRADGVRDQDIRWWWNRPDLERRMMTKFDDFNRSASLLDLLRQGFDYDKADAQVRRCHPIYGEPVDTSHTTGDDRPLPPELRDRVNIYIQNRSGSDPEGLKRDIEACSTCNALIRREIRSGKI